ncbi:MAG: hypothetical protein BWY31_04705 [Lentisphaerae bacterium ADurb.Bin242]|nr:MAG: hypothetical protein BWY31_04705 [Lentisphaerae bacterium ADurb.Bin242]
MLLNNPAQNLRFRRLFRRQGGIDDRVRFRLEVSELHSQKIILLEMKPKLLFLPSEQLQQRVDGKQMPVFPQDRTIAAAPPEIIIPAEIPGKPHLFRQLFHDGRRGSENLRQTFRLRQSPVPPDDRLRTGGKVRKIQSVPIHFPFFLRSVQ